MTTRATVFFDSLTVVASCAEQEAEGSKSTRGAGRAGGHPSIRKATFVSTKNSTAQEKRQHPSSPPIHNDWAARGYFL